MSTFGKCEGGGRRSARRESAPLIAVFSSTTRSDGAVVVDLSATGIRLRGDSLPKTNELVEVMVEAIRAFGIVTWSEHGECGIEFEPPLAPEELHQLKRTVATFSGLPPTLKADLDEWMAGYGR